MKRRLTDQVLISLSGAMLIAASVLGVFDPPFEGWQAKICFVLLCAAVAALGVFCLVRPWNKSKSQHGFVHQETENGDIGISLKAIEKLEVKCLDRHEELTATRISISDVRVGW